MKRLIITGANGSGKSHLASRLGALRPEIPVMSFDAMKLTRGWEQRPRAEIDADLERAITEDHWILEGGPSLLSRALEHADGVIWLDPPEPARAWHLAIRPWANFGKTRPELPPGNDDWPLAQYRFALRSLAAGSKIKHSISSSLEAAQGLCVWHCRTQSQIDEAVIAWHEASGKCT